MLYFWVLITINLFGQVGGMQIVGPFDTLSTCRGSSMAFRHESVVKSDCVSLNLETREFKKAEQDLMTQLLAELYHKE